MKCGFCLEFILHVDTDHGDDIIYVDGYAYINISISGNVHHMKHIQHACSL
jgi:hypothetical protein